MNDTKRSNLKRALQLLDQASNIVDDVSDKESDAMDNMPENLQDSERFSAMERAVDLLNDASTTIEEAVSLINDAILQR